MPMNIVDVQTDLYRIPLPVVLSDATHGDISHVELVTVRVRTAEGQEGLGYTYTPGVGGAGVHALVDRYLGPLLLGQDPLRIEALWEQMWWHLHFVGRGGAVSFAIAAVDIALWDLKGRLLGQPLWKLLGGHCPAVDTYAGGIDLQFTLDNLCKQTQEFLARGFRAIKMKVGRDRLSEDVARVAAIRQLVGHETPLLVDANMRWSVDEAVRAARALSKYDVYWLEEPIIPDDVEGHVRVARDGGVPIATGENFHTLYEFQRLIAAGGVSFPEPDVATVGGVSVWMKVATLAQAYNLPVTTHGVHDIQVHLLAAVPNASYLEVHGFALDRFLAHPLELRDGKAMAPDRPGHGIDLSWEALEPHRDRG
jgi:L-alanine-DL-glutamate epimerase-like enolase superfamily enzyme